ncbi:MAG: hypothetical protein QOH85_251, partial [Acidobacteriaceae bacterium]|nr:hypothetical protein [Acidobacteriaceae bacterium]
PFAVSELGATNPVAEIERTYNVSG